MRSSEHLLDLLPSLNLQRLGPDQEAGLLITSLPWPRLAPKPLSLDGHTTYTQQLGQWPDTPAGTPRRLLMVADNQGNAPQELSLQDKNSSSAGELPTAEMVLFDNCPYEEYVWERHYLKLSWGDRSIGLLLGLRHAGEVHWWEGCRLISVEQTDECLVLEMGGAITRQDMSIEEFRSHPGYSNPYLHNHNWLNGQLHIRAHSNGVCEVYARHVNSRFFDDGKDLEDVVPVVGFLSGDNEATAELGGAWDGSREEFTLGGVRFDVAEVARLATPEQPGNITQEGQFLAWQPYLGMELYGGVCPFELTGDPYVLHAEEHKVLRGMSRTLRFSLSFSDRSPHVARYLAPGWWYGLCEELQPAPLLPVGNRFDDKLLEARTWVTENLRQQGFEEGLLPRHLSQNEKNGNTERNEPGWEGEIAYGAFICAWRYGNAEEYDSALRASYFFSDVCIDHAAKMVRMHGYADAKFAVPMNRLQCTIAAWLETGDPFLRQAAESVTLNSHYTHLNSWPRLGVGRDAMYMRSAMLLYRYTGEEYFRRIAHETGMTVVHAQRANGSFGDQGGGTGIHQWGGYITKPWMGLMALNGVLDYLEMFPDTPEFLEAVRRFADWLMSERLGEPGSRSWRYQHDFKELRRFYNPFTETWTELPSGGPWHQETLGRLLTYAAIYLDDERYFQAWLESHDTTSHRGIDHATSAALQFLPWVQDRLWNATLTREGVAITPQYFGPQTPEDATITTPTGALSVHWTPEAVVETPAGVEVHGVEHRTVQVGIAVA